MRILPAMLALLLLAPALCAQVSIDEKPRRYMIIKVDGAAKEWEIRPWKVTDKGGRTMQGASEGDFKLDVERWERTGLYKRYNTKLWKQAVADYLRGGPKATDGSRFYFYAINPRQPRAEGVVNLFDERKHIYWVPANTVEVKGYPQTWVDVYESFVTRQEGDARRQAVKDWEAAHRDIIKNLEDSEDGFSPEERNEFARFYQAQFVYVRDQNPTLAAIYDELAAFHRERNNLDAELSTYLDALRAGVAGDDRERFALAVGRIFVNRLNLPGEAIPYLTQAPHYTEALYLLSHCYIETEQYDLARTQLNNLTATLTAMPEGTVLETTAEEELGRAYLTLGELEFKLLNLVAANDAVGKIAKENASWDAGQVLFCAMLLQRNEPKRDADKSDAQKIRETLKTLSFWQTAQGYTNPQPATDFPLDPLMAQALVIYAQTDSQYTAARPDKTDRKPSAEVIRFLTAAKALDPLSAEPYLAEGRLYQRLGQFTEALAVYREGLDVDPRHVLLNFAVADLNLKGGVVSVAKDHLSRCLKYSPSFYPAHTLLGEMALDEVERVRASLILRMNAGEMVDYAGELVPPMKEAAAFFTSSLSINGDQPATKLALATLDLRLAEVAPLGIADRDDAESVRKAYIGKARDLSKELIDKLEKFAESEQPKNMNERELAQVPSLGCYNIYAFALYTLGDHDRSLEAFQKHIENARKKEFIPDNKVRKEYEMSASLAYAQNWVQRIEQNQRQYFETDEFDHDSTKPSGATIWYNGNWTIPTKLKPDLGFTSDTRIAGGRLKLVVDQKESGVMSRIEVEKPHGTLSTFEAEFTQVSDVAFDRGVFITKVVKGSGSVDSEAEPKCSIFLGIDSQGRVFWESRKYDMDDKNQVEKRVGYGLVDISLYGGVPLNPEDRLTLSIRRQLSNDHSDIEYIAIINGWETKLPVELDELTRVDFNQSRYAVHCGFFTRALTGVKGTVEVDRAKFIYDSGQTKK
ncbi:MAG: hypothetical protein KDB90_02345 [Planctomycetes bacterium]|nr:hypothetical protein [Planctomycetota bacterium]